MRGGKRAGAGAPKKPADQKKESKGIRLPQYLWDWLDTQDEPRGIVIEKALKQVHRLMILLPLLILTGCGAAHNKTATLTAMSLVDLAQSVEMQEIGSKEINPLLSDNPSIGEMAVFGLVGDGAFYLTDKHMKPSRFKTVLLDSILETEKANIEANRNVLRYGKRTVSNTTMIIICFRR